MTRAFLRVWLDDERPAPDPSWTATSSALEVIGYLTLQDVEKPETLVEVVSLDHDLGLNEMPGYYVLEWVERELGLRGLASRCLPLPEFRVHSANPPAHDRMVAAIESIERLKVKLSTAAVE